MSFFSDFWEYVDSPDEPEDMVRNVWGTSCSDRDKPYSFTFYTFSEEDLDWSDAERCESKFVFLIDRWIRQNFPKHNWNFDNGEADGWFTEMIRREVNIPIAFDSNDFLKWVFEVNHEEEDIGELSEIV